MCVYYSWIKIHHISFNFNNCNKNNMPTASNKPTAAAAAAAANTPAHKTRLVLQSLHSLPRGEVKDNLITAFCNAVTPENDTTQNSEYLLLLDDALAQISNKLEHANFSHKTGKLTAAGREYINDQQLLSNPPQHTNSTQQIEELYRKDMHRWKYINDQDSEPLIVPRGRGKSNKSIRVIRGRYSPTYNYGDSGFYSIRFSNGDGSFLVIFGISKGGSKGTNSQGINGRIKETHTKHAGRGYVTVIRGIPTNVLDVFELMIKKTAFPLRPDDHVGTELVQVDTEEDANEFTGMIVSFAFTLVVEGKNLVIPADINHPENDDFISIKKPSQEEEGITYVEDHPQIYKARYCNHTHYKYEETNPEAGEMNYYIA